MNVELEKILKLIYLSHNLKREERHCWFSDGRRESVADHIFCMSLMAMLLIPHLQEKPNVEKIFKMILVHDLVEAEAGDTPFFLSETPEGKAKKQEKEMRAIENIRKLLDSSIGEEIYDLWMEFEEKKSLEAQICTAIDKLEASIQHNNSPIHTWTDKDQLRAFQIGHFCNVDPVFQELNRMAVAQATIKMQNAGIDVEKVKANI
jgi:putative hydrolase of HD superfamily